MAATTEQTRRISALFDKVAPRYDALNRVMSLGLDHKWRRALIRTLGPAAGRRILDLGCGTGDVTMAIRDGGDRPVGLDPSREMLVLAREKAPDLDWVQADALHLPFKDGAFKGSTSSFVLRNLPDRLAAFREQARALAKGGIAAHLDLTRPPHGFQRLGHAIYVRGLVPVLGLFSTNREAYRYLARTVMEVPAPEVFAGELDEAGLANTNVNRLTMGAVSVVSGERAYAPAANL